MTSETIKAVAERMKVDCPWISESDMRLAESSIRAFLRSKVMREMQQALSAQHITNAMYHGKEYTTTILWSTTECALAKLVELEKELD